MDELHVPLLIVLAGINGAGKSTFHDLNLKHLNLPLVNADLIAQQDWPEDADEHAYEAAARAQEIRAALLRERNSFVVETVFSHRSKVELLKQARSAGYRVLLIYVHLMSTDLAKMRVSERVERGGHAVPAEKIVERYPRLLRHLAQSINIADDVLLFDNSFLDEPFRHVATFRHGKIVRGGPDLPAWASRLRKETFRSLTNEPFSE